MYILGIESSCDDTSVALLEINNLHLKILAQKTASQIDVHKKYGGVVPEIAGRKHAEYILPVVEEVLTHARANGFEKEKPDAIAATTGPGLITGLLVGAEVAKTLSYLWNIPLIPTNHIDGHIHSVELGADEQSARQPIAFPALCLVVSGGHTELILMKDHGQYERIGKTRDDAAGECFDKAAKLLGLEYPGGPKISKLAVGGDIDAIPFPRPMIKEENYDFSFAGLKTAVLYWLRDHAPYDETTQHFTLEHQELHNFCASFEEAIIDVLVSKTIKAVNAFNPKSVLLIGGVSANKKLRDTLRHAVAEKDSTIEYRLSPLEYSMDNASMIAVAGYYKYKKNETVSWKDITVDPNWRIA